MPPSAALGIDGAPDKTRTCDLQVRNLALYPTELRALEAGKLANHPAPRRSGGESGIRTHGTVSGTRTFQARAFSHSAISPTEGSNGSTETKATPRVRNTAGGRIRGWRRGRDSNPRYGFPYADLANLCLQPLGHLSGTRKRRIIAAETRRRRAPGPDSAAHASEASPTGRREKIGGEGGIRTLETLSRLAVFKTAAFDRSATSPRSAIETVARRHGVDARRLPAADRQLRQPLRQRARSRRAELAGSARILQILPEQPRRRGRPGDSSCPGRSGAPNPHRRDPPCTSPRSRPSTTRPIRSAC